MHLTYNENDQALEIHDDLRTQYLIYKGLLLLILSNALIRIYNRPEEPVSSIQTIWAILGIISILILCFFLFRKSAAEKIELKDIKRLKVYSLFGRKRCVFELKNGKYRKLSTLQSDQDFDHLLHLCARIGIAV